MSYRVLLDNLIVRDKMEKQEAHDYAVFLGRQAQKRYRRQADRDRAERQIEHIQKNVPAIADIRIWRIAIEEDPS